MRFDSFPGCGAGTRRFVQDVRYYTCNNDIFVSWFRTRSSCEDFVHLSAAIMTYYANKNVELIKTKIIAMRKTAVAEILDTV